MNSGEETNLNDLGDEEVMVEKTIENKHSEICDNVMVDEEDQETNEEHGIEMDTKDNDNLSDMFINIYDPGRWEHIDNKLRGLLVDKGSTRESDKFFSKDGGSRHSSISYYIKELPNGERHDRRWLVYSKDFDKVYCFCCKLFGTKSSVNQLGNEGTNYWFD